MPPRKGELGAKTRSKKQKELTPARAAQGVGCPAHRRRTRRPGGGLRPGDRGGPAGDASGSGGLRHRPFVSEKLSVFPERELKRVALLHGLGDVTPEQVAAELPRQGVIAR